MADCREYIALLATAYVNQKTVPLFFKSLTDAVQTCEDITLDGKTFKAVSIVQYGLNPGDKEYIDPARYGNYDAAGKYGLEIDGHLRILCQTAAERDTLKAIIWPKKKPKTVMLFANGYRNWVELPDISAENPTTTNQVYMQDNTDNGKPYWTGIDAGFIARRKPEKVYYADGHHSITTSNHNVNGDATASKAFFLTNMNCMRNQSEYNLCNQPLLHTTPNHAGFNTRVSNGRTAGANWVTQLLRDYPGLSSGTDTITIDIVAHSMGFAYAQGMIEALKQSRIKAQIKWGGYYILAPENGSAGDIGSMDFDEIWQYGSDLNQPGADPMWLQDGVAPQAAVSGINNLPSGSTKGGRAYIPKNQGIPKGFVNSHSVGNYGWIFEIKTSEPSGYITPR